MTDHTAAPMPLHFRQSRAARLYALAFGVVWVGMLGSITVATLPDPAALIPLGMLVFGGLITWRMLQLGVSAEADELIVRNYYRTHRIPRSEIDGFRFGRLPWQPMGGVIYAMVRNGDLIPLDVTMEFGAYKSARDRQAERTERLNHWARDVPSPHSKGTA